MATTVLPTRADGSENYSFRCQMGAATFEVGLRWNRRESLWGISVSDAVGNLLLTRRVAVGIPIMFRLVDPRLPYGEILAVDTSGEDLDPGLTEMSPTGRVQLTFTDAADIAAITG